MIESGTHDEVIRALEDLVLAYPDYVPALNDLGVLYYGKEDNERALDYLTKAIGKDPLYRPAVANATQVLKTLSQTDTAAALLDCYLEHNPLDSEMSALLQTLHQ